MRSEVTDERDWLLRRDFLEKRGYRLRFEVYRVLPGEVKAEDSQRGYDLSEYLKAKPAIRTPISASKPAFPTASPRRSMDAQRVSDGSEVLLQSVSTAEHPQEVEIARLLSSPPHSGHPRNHSIPILDILDDPLDPDRHILVMVRCVGIDDSAFDTVGEVVDCLRQIFQSIEYMHEHFIAHRDCNSLNFVQDPTRLYPDGFHPVVIHYGRKNRTIVGKITRTECWPRYFAITCDLSRQYDPANGRASRRHGSPSECNPFPTDIYFLGNMIKKDFLYVTPLHHPEWVSVSLRPSAHRPLLFLQPLIDEMTLPDPASRPTIGEAIQKLDDLCGRLSNWELRQPGVRMAWYDRLEQRFRQFGRMVRGVKPVPVYVPRTDRVSLSGEMRAFYTQRAEVVEDGDEEKKERQEFEIGGTVEYSAIV
ncbi:hypothetical protein FB45DRAFT_938828 [Roridomyces roridus]|uniref:Protein kinase domain-containing protein n=1 Tax=Roridomyces roridus TaxID=1738132 RepID=A0AAD7FAY0_9AGAR|nr:hypothetical protein FB45DRAFT_938828 [Roridomyces roridus]